MVMLASRSGPHAGQQIWSCSAYPLCRGMVAVAGDPPRAEPQPISDARPRRISPVWLLALGLVPVAILLAFLLTQA
jgi:hypothetical protein